MSSTIARHRNTVNTPTPIITVHITIAVTMPSRLHQAATMRITTSLVIIGMCIFAAPRGWSTADFAIARAGLSSKDEQQVGPVRAWIGAPGLTAAAMRASFTEMTDAADLDGAHKRADELTALLAVRPLSSADWLSLAEMRLVAGQAQTDVLAALRMSHIAGPNEGSIMWQRGIFGLLIWELLPPDALKQAINEDSG